MGPWRWVVLFFTRPVHLSDVKGWLRPRRNEAAEVAVKAVEELASIPPVRPHPPFRTSAAPPRPLALRDPALEVGVSEQPLDTLPAELQSEFDSIAKRQAERARSREHGAEG